MSNYEVHRVIIKKVDLLEFDNDTEKYFEARCKYEFEGYGDRWINDLYKEYGNWQDMFFDETFICDVIIVNGEPYEIADTQVNRDKQCIIKPIEPGKYEYEIRYNNGETSVLEMIENGLSDYLG
jgi:hypothetical protein